MVEAAWLAKPRAGSWLSGFGFSLFPLLLCVPVNGNHKHVQVWNITNTISFPVRHNNNNKHRGKPNNKLGEKGFFG